MLKIILIGIVLGILWYFTGTLLHVEFRTLGKVKVEFWIGQKEILDKK